MKMSALVRYSIPAEVIALWQARESETLLPLQELVVKQHGLFAGGNLLIQAPTSSGKTFIGEMAALETALRRKKVVYMVPLKALAEEKFEDFHAKYTPYGLKVIISTRDRREFDADLEAGDFSIAVVVYEKLAQLLVRRPERLAEVDLVVADELEILSDPERGAMAELLLTRVLRSGRRLIGLSAVIGGAERLAAWMDARLVHYERRPVELRYGVLHDGVFTYRTHNEAGEGKETMAESGGDTPWEVMTENVCMLAGRGESVLIFVKAKHEARHGAGLLAGRVDGAPAVEAIECLRGMERTRARDALIETLGHGVAFHNADLAPAERKVVEGAFRSGAVKVLVSTSTLAVGLNLPAQNVFLSAEKWRYDPRLDIPWKAPLLRMEYENMGGRAGRYGAGHDFGRSILVATTPFDQETLWRRYIEGEREPIAPQLDQGPLEDQVLGLVASRCCRTQDELVELLEGTLTGRWVWAERYPLHEIAFKVRAAVNRCVDAGVLAEEEGQLSPTPYGRVAAAKGVGIATARALEHWLRECEARVWPDIDLLHAVASTPDGRMLQVGLTAREYDHADYAGRLRARTREADGGADTPLNRMRAQRSAPLFEETRAIKVALMLDEWIGEEGLHAIEERYNTMAGQLLGASEQAAWLIDAAAAIGVTVGAAPEFVARLEALRDRVKHGVDAALLPLARADLGLNRSMLLGLHARGLHRPDFLAALPGEVPGVPRAVGRRVLAWARQAAARSEAERAIAAAPAAPVLIVDDRHAGGVQLDGQRVELQEKQYRLIRVLAAHAGECVPYAVIYEAVWGREVVVEDGQIHFQKRMLLERIRGVLPGRTTLIKTIPKRGYLLQLGPEDVLLREAARAA